MFSTFFSSCQQVMVFSSVTWEYWRIEWKQLSNNTSARWDAYFNLGSFIDQYYCILSFYYITIDFYTILFYSFVCVGWILKYCMYSLGSESWSRTRFSKVKKRVSVRCSKQPWELSCRLQGVPMSTAISK